MAGKLSGQQLRAAGYRNPLRGIQGLAPERIDMGVDYSGRGPFYSVGPGVVALSATGPGSPWYGAVGAPVPGTWIAVRLTSGPFRGQYFYVAEDIVPRVRTGQRVTSSTVLGMLTGGIETGWAAAPGTHGETLAAASHQEAAHGDPGAHSTAYGVAFSNLISALGGPPGVLVPPVSGTVPPGFGVAPGGTVVGGGGGTGGGAQSTILAVMALAAAAGILVTAAAVIGVVIAVTGRSTTRAARPR